MTGWVEAVSASSARGVTKALRPEIVLVEGQGVLGDIHCGASIRHLARMERDPTQPNLRQVHLLNAEFLDELGHLHLPVRPGQMGENILVRGLNLLSLLGDTVIGIGANAKVKVTGLRNPCKALDTIHPGLMAATLRHDAHGEIERRAGVMGVVSTSGAVGCGDKVWVVATPKHGAALQPV